MKVIAIVPARGGSKRIPRKNIRAFAGIPMLTRTLSSMRKSAIFSEIIVSTDDDEIIELAMANGALIHKRSDLLSNDYATTLDVIAESCSRLINQGESEETLVCCVYPATPLLDFRRVNQAVEVLLREKCDFVFPIKRSETPIGRFFELDDNYHLQIYDSLILEKRSQDLDDHYFDAGQFYVGLARTWSNRSPIISARSIGLMLGKYEVIDIDEEEDWEYAEELFTLRALRKT